MAFIFAILLVVLVGGLLARLLLADGRPGRDDADVTDRDPRPPAHPTDPIPGSATDRNRHGKP